MELEARHCALDRAIPLVHHSGCRVWRVACTLYAKDLLCRFRNSTTAMQKENLSRSFTTLYTYVVEDVRRYPCCPIPLSLLYILFNELLNLFSFWISMSHICSGIFRYQFCFYNQRKSTVHVNYLFYFEVIIMHISRESQFLIKIDFFLIEITCELLPSICEQNIYRFRYLYFRGKNHMIQNIHPHSLL